MGLFGGTTIAVASTAYNMAGDVNERMNYLKSTVSQAVIGNNNFDLTQCLNDSYMTGPGIKARNFCRWALSHYDGVGIPRVNLGFQSGVSNSLFVPYLPVDAGQTASIIDVRLDYADLTFWAEQWLLVNNPSMLNDAWEVTQPTDPLHATITYSDTTSVVIPITDFTSTENYFYVLYSVSDGTGVVGSRMWIYKIGSGDADLDAMTHTSLDTDNVFFPIIPVRLNNNFLSETYMPSVYALTSKAYKKATNQKISKLVDQLKDNSSLPDIDHIYVVYGCALNTPENAARKYIFTLFKQIAAASTVTMADFDNWRDQLDTYNTSGGAYPYQPYNQMEIKETGSLLDTYYHIIMSWSGITHTSTPGIHPTHPGVKPGDTWFTMGDTYDDGNVDVGGVTYSQGSSNTIYMYQQFDDHYEIITVANLLHENLIYKDKSVKITAAEALADADESGFIVPLSYEIQREMSIIDSTQMMTSALYLVMNSYVVHKQKWYETGIFKIIVFIAIIAITVATGGAGAPLAGLLGTAASVGAAVGLTGLAAVIVGAIINAIAAMILMKLIGMVSVAIFGPKIGAIIGAIIAVIAVAAGTGLMNGQSLSAVFGNMLSAQNLIGMTSSVGNGIAGYLQASAQGWATKTEDITKQYDKASKDIMSKYMTDFGLGFNFDTFSLTDIGKDLSNAAETLDGFLQRTLMTGTDIAEMSIDMLSKFTDITLNTGTTFSS